MGGAAPRLANWSVPRQIRSQWKAWEGGACSYRRQSWLSMCGFLRTERGRRRLAGRRGAWPIVSLEGLTGMAARYVLMNKPLVFNAAATWAAAAAAACRSDKGSLHMGGQLRPLPGAPRMFTGETVAMATGASGRGGPLHPRAAKEERKVTGRATMNRRPSGGSSARLGPPQPPAEEGRR